jgi:hypothetical protein
MIKRLCCAVAVLSSVFPAVLRAEESKKPDAAEALIQTVLQRELDSFLEELALHSPLLLELRGTLYGAASLPQLFQKLYIIIIEAISVGEDARIRLARELPKEMLKDVILTILTGGGLVKYYDAWTDSVGNSITPGAAFFGHEFFQQVDSALKAALGKELQKALSPVP